jgi:hypothetical protein
MTTRAGLRNPVPQARGTNICGPINNAQGGYQCSEQDAVVCGHMQDAVGVMNIDCGTVDFYVGGLGHTYGTVTIKKTGQKFCYDPWGWNCSADPPHPC